MSFCSRILRTASGTPIPVAKQSSKRNGTWKRPKHAEKRLPAPDSLEQRQTVSDTFFVALQAAGASLLGNIAAEKARDPFGLTNTLDMSVSDGSEQNRAAANRVTPQAPQSLVPLADGPDSDGTRASGIDRADRDNSTSSRLAEWKTDDDLASARDDTLPEGVDSSAVQDAAPRPHGVIRKLQLAPPAFAVGGSTTFVADAAPALQPGSRFEIPQPAQQPAANEPVPAASPRPNIPAGPGGKVDSNVSAASAAESGGAVFDSGKSKSVTANAASDGGTPSVSDTPEGSSSLMISPTGTAGETVSLQSGVSETVFSAGSQCVQTPPNQSGGGPPVVPPGPPCTPPGQQTSSPPDPLYVLNWESNHGLVAFPGLVEYDKDGQWVELRGQVNGATVSTWSWDTSQAGRAGCISGSSTYKLRFRWQNYYPNPSTNTITVTATMTDSSTQSATLTFYVPAGGGGTCPSTPASATWPAVLEPDKPAESQDLLASDSATRPYAVSKESGVLYVTHDLPAYQPSSDSAAAMHMPGLGLTYSSIAAERRPIFINRYELDPSASVPETVSARLKFDGTWGSSKYYDTSPSSAKWNPGDIIQISLQADAGSLATGRYGYDFETKANYSGGCSTPAESDQMWRSCLIIAIVAAAAGGFVGYNWPLPPRP